GLGKELVEAADEVALEAAECHAAHSLGLLAGEVGGGCGVVTSGIDREAVQREVELAVAAAVEAVTVLASGGGGDGCNAGSSGELRVAFEAVGAGDFGEQLGGCQWAAAGHGHQLRTKLADEQTDLLLELADTARQAADLAHQVAGDPYPRRLRASAQPSQDAVKPYRPIERTGRDRKIVVEIVQVPAQPLLRLAARLDEIVVVVK